MAIKRYESNAVYSKVVEANGFVHTAGIIPGDLSKDVKGQTADVLAEIDRLLALCGASKGHIMSATIWLNDIRHREHMNEAWVAWVGGDANAPTRACVEAKLVDPRMLVEIAVVAAKSL
jgi:enamine deaminase RidA (YjgF/YER057c/UK114 family)